MGKDLEKENKELKFKIKLKDALLDKSTNQFQKTINILNLIDSDDEEFKKVKKILSEGTGYMKQIGKSSGQVDIVRYSEL